MGLAVLPNNHLNGQTADGPEVQANHVELRDSVNNIENEQIVDLTIKQAKIEESGQTQVLFADAGGQNFVVDALNWISVTTSGDLNYTVPEFIAYVGAVRIKKTGGLPVRLYTASRDTYVDMDNAGVMRYSEVSNGALAPAQVAGEIRLLKVVTDGSTVTDVVTLVTDVAFVQKHLFEQKIVEINPLNDAGSAETPGNQKIKVIFRGLDKTGQYLLDTGPAGIEIDLANKEVANGLDQNVVVTAFGILNIWIIGAADGSQPVAGLASYEDTPYGEGDPLYPTDYDIGRWVSLAIVDGTARLIPAQTIKNETIFMEHAKNVFTASNNNNWNLYDFDPSFAIKEHVGAVRISFFLKTGNNFGYGDHSITGSTTPASQDGAVLVGQTKNEPDENEDAGVAWLPLVDGKANIYHEGVVDGAGSNGQQSNAPAKGVCLTGWKYHHD